ncbi:MAG: hypothetical protein KGZ71_12435 [Desulfobulbaceae bacterium]|nr:hypothetical protein [Desulfobulbaceae bacterium]
MKKLILMFIFYSIAIFSQDPAYLIFRNSGNVYLKWEYLRDNNHEHYNIYRQYENSDTWEQINPKPLKLITDIDEIVYIGGEYYGSIYLSLMGVKREKRDITKSDIIAWQNNAEAYSMLNALSVTQPLISELTGTSFLDTPESRARVRYKINSIRAADELHYITSEFIDTKIDDIVPTPEDISIKPLNNSASIIWARSLDVLQSGRAVNFNIYRADNITGPYLIVNFADMFQGVLTGEEVEVDTNYFNFVDDNLINGKTYYYYLTGVNTFGFESQRTSVYEVVPSDNRVPMAPGDITINEFGGRLKLSWRNISRVRPIGYEIFKSIGDTDNFVKVFPTLDAQYDATITTWTDADVREGEFYSYYLVAIGQSGARSETSDTLTFIIDDYIPPAAPVGVVAVGDTGAIKLSWEANTEHDLLGYQIERSSDSRFATRFLVTDKPITGTEFIDTVRRESQSDIAYFVYALDKSYNRSLPSERVIVRVIDVVPPLTPEMTSIYEEDDKYFVNWTKSPDNDLKAYRLYLSIGDSSSFTLKTETTSLSFSDRISERKEHFFKVVAVDLSGNESLFSRIRRLQIEDETPRPPDSVQVIQEEKYVNIEWKAPEDERVVGFFIQRNYAEKGSPMVDLAVLKADKSRFMDWDVDITRECTYYIYSRDEKWRLSKPVIINFGPKSK